jgi:hypothetical protein
MAEYRQAPLASEGATRINTDRAPLASGGSRPISKDRDTAKYNRSFGSGSSKGPATPISPDKYAEIADSVRKIDADVAAAYDKAAAEYTKIQAENAEIQAHNAEIQRKVQEQQMAQRIAEYEYKRSMQARDVILSGYAQSAETPLVTELRGPQGRITGIRDNRTGKTFGVSSQVEADVYKANAFRRIRKAKPKRP